jgi:hypothetical protein
MEPTKFALCPLCTECPQVVITEEAITIGEARQHRSAVSCEWNELARLIKSGELGEV